MLTLEHTSPGGWLAAAVPGRLVIVHRETADSGFASALWGALCADDGIRLVIDMLTRGGLHSAPAFVLVEWDGAHDAYDTRFIVRGETGVVLDTASGHEEITAQGVSTWVERPVGGVRGFRIECIPAEPAGAGPLPLSVGCGWVSSVSMGSLANSYAEVAENTPASEWAPVDVDLGATIADLEESVSPTPDPQAAVAEPPTEVVPVADPRLSDPAASAYDHLFGATMMRSVEDAAVRPDEIDPDAESDEDGDATPAGPPQAGGAILAPPTAAPVADAPLADAGDHDGYTVMSGDVRKLREQSAARSAESPAAGASGASQGEAPSPEPTFLLRLPTGSSEPIDSMVVVGRAPSVSKMAGGRVPRLVTVDSAEHDISRNHVQLTVEGGTVVVTDLHSRNGTSIVLPGKAPQKLRAGEPTSILVGTVIDLGSGVALSLDQT